MHRSTVVAAALALSGCAGLHPQSPEFPPGEALSTAPSSTEGDEAAEERAIVNDPNVISAAKNVRVVQNDHLDCPSEVLGLVDIHEPVDSVDRALEILKRKAAKIGAEAVIGVEFHHGEPGEGRRTCPGWRCAAMTC
jgi:hypothetical protein